MDRSKQLLLATLENLAESELETFQFHLKQNALPGFDAISESQLGHADRLDTVELMVQTYRPDGALKMAVEILRQMSRNDLLEKIQAESMTGNCY
uniref:Pyrin domain-containing protein n=1 Tax=Myripristis murdjan TaxID=586833 RepID=A0A667WJX3_9TELE